MAWDETGGMDGWRGDGGRRAGEGIRLQCARAGGGSGGAFFSFRAFVSFHSFFFKKCGGWEREREREKEEETENAEVGVGGREGSFLQ